MARVAPLRGLFIIPAARRSLVIEQHPQCFHLHPAPDRTVTDPLASLPNAAQYVNVNYRLPPEALLASDKVRSYNFSAFCERGC